MGDGPVRGGDPTASPDAMGCGGPRRPHAAATVVVAIPGAAGIPRVVAILAGGRAGRRAGGGSGRSAAGPRAGELETRKEDVSPALPDHERPPLLTQCKRRECAAVPALAGSRHCRISWRRWDVVGANLANVGRHRLTSRRFRPISGDADQLLGEFGGFRATLSEFGRSRPSSGDIGRFWGNVARSLPSCGLDLAKSTSRLVQITPMEV